jgi:hypothetical protein
MHVLKVALITILFLLLGHFIMDLLKKNFTTPRTVYSEVVATRLQG